MNMRFKLNREIARPPTHLKTTVMLNAPIEIAQSTTILYHYKQLNTGVKKT